jgi:predicted transcriptional regulator
MRGFGALQAQVMDHMWSASTPLSVREVREMLDRPLAHTTVMTVLDNLYKKGWLDREARGNAYIYWPRMPRQEYSARLMREALDDSRDARATLVHFVQDISDEEAAALRAALRYHRRRPGG